MVHCFRCIRNLIVRPPIAQEDLMRTLLLTVTLAAAVLLGAAPGLAAAQSATPGAGPSALAALGYPDLAIRVSEAGFQMPSQATAGRTLITLTNVGAQSRHGRLLRLPDDL